MAQLLLSIQGLEPERPGFKPVTYKLGNHRQGTLISLNPNFFVSKIKVIIILSLQSAYVN